MHSGKRSATDQVKSGFFIACRLVFGFLVFVLATAGIALLSSPPPAHHFVGHFGAFAAVCLAATIMFFTAHRWGGFIAGFFFLPGAYRAFGAFLAGYDYSFPPRPLPRLESGIFMLYSIAVIAMVWRFIGRRRKRVSCTMLDRTALTAFALSIMIFVVHTESYAWPIGGLVVLFIPWAIFRWQNHKSRRRDTIPVHSAT